MSSTASADARLARALLTLGAAVLAVEPLGWLVTSWRNHPLGAGVALCWAGLLVRSVCSGRRQGQPDDRVLGWIVLGAVLRVIGRMLGVQIIGSLVLVLDAFAIASLLGSGRRPWVVSPLGSALPFAMALPVERVAARVLGFPLRLVSAEVVADLVGGVREGTRILGEVEVAVDAPCSGVQGLTLLMTLALGLGAVVGPRRRWLWWTGPVLALVGALLANTVRLGLLYRGQAGGLAVMEEPLHSIVGTVGLVLGALPLLIAARGWERLPSRFSTVPHRLPPAWMAAVGLLALAGALWPVPQPVSALPELDLPASVGDALAAPVPVSEHERHYLDRVGVALDKVRYVDASGSSTVMLARGAAAWRMHDPSVCLEGQGWTLSPLGEEDGAASFLATTPDGGAWFVRQRYLAPVSSGAALRAGTSAEALWRSLWQPNASGWVMVLQVHPWQACATDGCVGFDSALLSALEV